MRRSWSRWLAVLGTLATGVVFSALPASAGAVSPAGTVKPNATSNMDCNNHSPIYHAARSGLGAYCTDPIDVEANGTTGRFYDNGHYVGHDEPSVKFISNQAGSGNNMTWLMQLAVDPKAKPTANGSVTKYAELSPAPWFGLPICDPKSFPQNPCTPDSDTNNPNVAGSAFMELQFYAPGFQPFADGISCDPTKYCAALTIDSLEVNGAGQANNNCIEPVNFAFLQRDGVPSGPPSPQLTDITTLTPNAETLKMNQGDVLAVTERDTASGFETRITDFSTGQSGFMVASIKNGFMNTNIADCSGTPFAFHPEYSTASKQNQVPWAALEGGVLMQDELGHFETCNSVSSQLPVNNQFATGKTFSDANVFQVCNGGLEGPGATGEGPCNPATGLCVGSTTETGAPCPTNNFTAGALCEFSDANCMPAGNRTIFNNGIPQTVRWPVAGCQDNRFQNGDLDFEGTSYQKDWPDGSANHPTSFKYIGPFDGQGHTYPNIQYETDLGASEILCNVATGAGCTAPPVAAAFYPFWTLGKASAMSGGHGACVWNFGNVIPGTTVNSFGGAAEYGTPDVARFGGTLTSQVFPNPQLNTRC